VVFRLGFATSRFEARQLVRHGHFEVGGRKVDVPSFRVKPGHRIVLREKSRQIARITEALEALERRSIPGWLELEKESFSGVVKAAPTREDITMPIQEQLIVELYSR
jgi:small subunit ribosomal protein S4